MATLLPLAEQQFCDGDGAPLVGGQVFFYVPGTTKPKDTWSDPAGTIVNQNPVILDAAGRAVIYGVGSYRQVLKDSALNVIWDQVTSDTASSLTSWAGQAGGTANNIVLTAINFADIDGQAIDFLGAFTNTGPLQATVNGTAVPVKLDTVSGPVQTPAGCTAPGNRYRLTYDATAGLFHLSPLVDRGYVDGQDQSILSQAVANASAQVSGGVAAAESYAASVASQAQSAAIATSESYAASVAAQAQSAAISAAAADASAKANAAQGAAQSYAQTAANNAQNAAYQAAIAWANNADANVLSSANSYAAGQASSALAQAESYANQGDSNTLGTANGNAQYYANTAQANANGYTSQQCASTLQQAVNNATSQVSNLSNSVASTYSQGVRLSGAYGASYAGRQSGSVCVSSNTSSASTYAFLQYNINGTWYTAADA